MVIDREQLLEQLLEATRKFLEDIFEAQSRSETRIWWRGHSISKWELQPLVYRNSSDPIYEKGVVNYFMRKAPARYPSCPSGDSKFDWLFLMRHYGLPTRLLDWTESPLIALFFALREQHFEPSCLWALDPGKLNELQTGVASVLGSFESVDLAYSIVEEAFEGIQHEDCGKILAIQPTHFDTRMLLQQAVCTLHGMRMPLEQLENNKEFLWKIEISPDHKKHLWSLLDRFSIKRSTLFPDLESLAKELASYEYVHG